MAPRKPGRPRPREATEASPCEAKRDGCEIGDLFRLLGKSHVLDLLHVFTEEDATPLRFMDLQKRLHLSPNTLSDRLKELAEAGLITRTAYHEIPPRVDYEATVKAHEFRPVFDELRAWAARHSLQREDAEAPHAAEA